MKRLVSVFGKICLVLIPVSLLFTKTTDADMIDSKTIPNNQWEATTLDFTNRDTASDQVTNLLFNVSGLITGGFSVKSIRVKKDGQLNFKYQITSTMTAGDKNLCDNAGIDLYQNWVKVKSGVVSSFSYEASLATGGTDDWVMVARLLSSDKQLINKECDFDLKFGTVSDQVGGFYAERSLSNRITTGTW